MDNYESFISMDLNKFLGEWVAIMDNKVIAHSKNLKEVYELTKKIDSLKRPFITKIRTTVNKLL